MSGWYRGCVLPRRGASEFPVASERTVESMRPIISPSTWVGIRTGAEDDTVRFSGRRLPGALLGGMRNMSGSVAWPHQLTTAQVARHTPVDTLDN